MSIAEADYQLSKWIGAVFYHLIGLGKVPFEAVNDAKFEKRNVWTGYFLKIILVASTILLIINWSK